MCCPVFSGGWGQITNTSFILSLFIPSLFTWKSVWVDIDFKEVFFFPWGCHRTLKTLLKFHQKVFYLTYISWDSEETKNAKIFLLTVDFQNFARAQKSTRGCVHVAFCQLLTHTKPPPLSLFALLCVRFNTQSYKDFRYLAGCRCCSFRTAERHCSLSLSCWN